MKIANCQVNLYEKENATNKQVQTFLIKSATPSKHPSSSRSFLSLSYPDYLP
jgi:hypothetical protein